MSCAAANARPECAPTAARKADGIPRRGGDTARTGEGRECLREVRELLAQQPERRAAKSTDLVPRVANPDGHRRCERRRVGLLRREPGREGSPVVLLQRPVVEGPEDAELVVDVQRPRAHRADPPAVVEEGRRGRRRRRRRSGAGSSSSSRGRRGAARELDLFLLLILPQCSSACACAAVGEGGAAGWSSGSSGGGGVFLFELQGSSRRRRGGSSLRWRRCCSVEGSAASSPLCSHLRKSSLFWWFRLQEIRLPSA